jgi:hypothetical protein
VAGTGGAPAVQIVVERVLAGRRSGTRCVRPTPKLRRAPRCTRFARVRNLRFAGKAGSNTARVGGRALAPGKYRATLTATDAARNTSKRVRITFAVRRR